MSALAFIVSADESLVGLDWMGHSVYLVVCYHFDLQTGRCMTVIIKAALKLKVVVIRECQAVDRYLSFKSLDSRF